MHVSLQEKLNLRIHFMYVFHVYSDVNQIGKTSLKMCCMTLKLNFKNMFIQISFSHLY